MQGNFSTIPIIITDSTDVRTSRTATGDLCHSTTSCDNSGDSAPRKTSCNEMDFSGIPVSRLTCEKADTHNHMNIEGSSTSESSSSSLSSVSSVQVINRCLPHVDVYCRSVSEGNIFKAANGIADPHQATALDPSCPFLHHYHGHPVHPTTTTTTTAISAISVTINDHSKQEHECSSTPTPDVAATTSEPLRSNALDPDTTTTAFSAVTPEVFHRLPLCHRCFYICAFSFLTGLSLFIIVSSIFSALTIQISWMKYFRRDFLNIIDLESIADADIQFMSYPNSLQRESEGKKQGRRRLHGLPPSERQEPLKSEEVETDVHWIMNPIHLPLCWHHDYRPNVNLAPSAGNSSSFSSKHFDATNLIIEIVEWRIPDSDVVTILMNRHKGATALLHEKRLVLPGLGIYSFSLGWTNDEWFVHIYAANYIRMTHSKQLACDRYTGASLWIRYRLGLQFSRQKIHFLDTEGTGKVDDIFQMDGANHDKEGDKYYHNHREGFSPRTTQKAMPLTHMNYVNAHIGSRHQFPSLASSSSSGQTKTVPLQDYSFAYDFQGVNPGKTDDSVDSSAFCINLSYNTKVTQGFSAASNEFPKRIIPFISAAAQQPQLAEWLLPVCLLLNYQNRNFTTGFDSCDWPSLSTVKNDGRDGNDNQNISDETDHEKFSDGSNTFRRVLEIPHFGLPPQMQRLTTNILVSTDIACSSGTTGNWTKDEERKHKNRKCKVRQRFSILNPSEGIWHIKLYLYKHPRNLLPLLFLPSSMYSVIGQIHRSLFTAETPSPSSSQHFAQTSEDGTYTSMQIGSLLLNAHRPKCDKTLSVVEDKLCLKSINCPFYNPFLFFSQTDKEMQSTDIVSNPSHSFGIEARNPLISSAHSQTDAVAENTTTQIIDSLATLCSGQTITITPATLVFCEECVPPNGYEWKFQLAVGGKIIYTSVVLSTEEVAGGNQLQINLLAINLHPSLLHRELSENKTARILIEALARRRALPVWEDFDSTQNVSDFSGSWNFTIPLNGKGDLLSTKKNNQTIHDEKNVLASEFFSNQLEGIVIGTNYEWLPDAYIIAWRVRVIETFTPKEDDATMPTRRAAETRRGEGQRDADPIITTLNVREEMVHSIRRHVQILGATPNFLWF